MKTTQFHGSYTRRGLNFFLTICAKSQKEAAEKVEVSAHEIRTYWSKALMKVPFTEIKVEPYGHKSVEIFGHEKFAVNNILELIQLIDEKFKKLNKWKD